MRYEDDIKTARWMEINRPRGSGSVDKAPASQWTNASSNPRGAHFLITFGVRGCWAEARKLKMSSVVTDLMRQCGHCLHKEGGSVVKARWNALRGRHKDGAMNGNQYAARRCSMITRLTRNSLTWVRVRCGAAIFAHYISDDFKTRNICTVGKTCS